mgnify:CR=1 FL=1
MDNYHFFYLFSTTPFFWWWWYVSIDLSRVYVGLSSHWYIGYTVMMLFFLPFIQNTRITNIILLLLLPKKFWIFRFFSFCRTEKKHQHNNIYHSYRRCCCWSIVEPIYTKCNLLILSHKHPIHIHIRFHFYSRFFPVFVVVVVTIVGRS